MLFYLVKNYKKHINSCLKIKKLNKIIKSIIKRIIILNVIKKNSNLIHVIKNNNFPKKGLNTICMISNKI